MIHRHHWRQLLMLLLAGTLLVACANGGTASLAPEPSAVPTALVAVAAPSPALVPSPAPSPTPAPSATPEPSATPAPPQIIGYTGYTAVAGDTLASIADAGGSTPDLVQQYNLLDGEPAPERALIVPHVEGRASSLEDESILVDRGPADKPWVALTLDAGASAAPVPQMLQTLRERNVTITFFLTGKWIEQNPELARQIVADGHEIANHSSTHPDFRQLTNAAIIEELRDTEAIMRDTTGASTRPFFRPPFGAYDKRTLLAVEAQGYLPIYWTLDSLDSVGEPKSPAFLTERITAKLPPEQLRGAIILAHCGSQPTADALPDILDRFAAMGFEVKKLSEVLGAS